MPKFIPGLQLSQQFFHEVVRPILAQHFVDLDYSAALIGSGSEVLGFDDEMSADHDWGPRLQLFVRDEGQELCPAIRHVIRDNLPPGFEGYSTNFATADEVSADIIKHRVIPMTFRRFIRRTLGFDIDNPIEPADWLTFPQHALCEVMHGVIYQDGIGIQAARERFSYYPHDVWLYLMMASWSRITQEQHLWARAAIAGDELGSAIIASRLVREIMRLCFLMEKQYTPYPKWFGTAFSRLKCARGLEPHLRLAQFATTWQEREEHLCAAMEKVVAMHNAFGLTRPIPADRFQFCTRPFFVVDADAIIDAIRNCLTDERVIHIADATLIGGIDHISDNPDFLMLIGTDLRQRLRALYQ